MASRSSCAIGALRHGCSDAMRTRRVCSEALKRRRAGEEEEEEEEVEVDEEETAGKVVEGAGRREKERKGRREVQASRGERDKEAADVGAVARAAGAVLRSRRESS